MFHIKKLPKLSKPLKSVKLPKPEKLLKLAKLDKMDFFFFSVPLISLFLIEFASRGSIKSIGFWIISEPVQFLISLFLFSAIYFFLWANLNYRGISTLVYSVIWIVIAGIIGCKREILGTTLMPWDIMLGANAADILDTTSPSQLGFLTDGTFLLIVTINILFIVIIFTYQKGKFLKVKICNILTVASCVAIAAVILTLPRIEMSESSSICNKDGYIRGFIVSAKLWSELNNSSEAYASTVTDLQYDFTTKKQTNDIKPNIIIIMSEAFWDATLLPDVTYSEDPIPTFHTLAKEGISGELVSNTYGGMTDNVEFEVMTGFSLKYLPYQSNAYMSSIRKAIPSIPSYLKSLEYHTAAVHPNDDTFFNRNSIYPLIGIDRFIALSDMPDAKIKGTYVSDDTFADYVISEYKAVQKPVFMYNISIQNHWPYTKENYYPSYDIQVKCSKNIDKESLLALQNYAQGIHDADASLKKVVDYFRSVKDPTVIVFFGDHLPALTEQLGVYKKLGYIDSSISDAELFSGGENVKIENEKAFIQSQKIFKTPYLIWANYSTDMEPGTTLSANYFGVDLLEKIGLPLPPFYHFLYDYSAKVPINRYFLTIDASGMPFSETPPVYQNYESIYQNIQNNIMFGDQSESKLFQAGP